MESHTVSDALKEWKKERPDLDITTLRVMARLAALGKYLEQENDALASKFNLLGRDLRVLFALRRSAAPHALRPTDLFQQLLVPSGTMTRQLDRLAEQQLIERSDDPTDRRGTIIRLTARGLKLANVAIAESVNTTLFKKAITSLSAKDRLVLEKSLQALLDSVETPSLLKDKDE
jgi:DNA-binding MarR family transcriptional regulator